MRTDPRRLLLRSLVALLLAGCAAACHRPPATAPSNVQPGSPVDAARAHDRERVRELVESGAAVDASDRYGYTALMVAADAGDLELARYLLERGADPDRRDDFYHSSALEAALFGGHDEVAALLLRHGAADRELALEIAAQRGGIELARAAVESGPLYASRLEALRERSAALDPAVATLLAAADGRPDPDPPRYRAEELEPFSGVFEGWDSDLEARVARHGERLTLAIGEEAARELTVIGERSFRTADGSVQATFFGRAGTIEGISLRRGVAPPETLRRSVADVSDRAAVRIDAGPAATAASTIHWPGFRGANASGIGDGADAAIAWDPESGAGVLWQVAIEGLGNSSPVVWGDRVFLTTAVAEGIAQEIRTGLTGSGSGVDEATEHRWLVQAYDKHTGRKLWETEVGRDVPETRRHFKSSQANSTPVTDGRRLVVVFPTAGLACLDLDGNLLWKRDLGGLNAGAFTDPGIEWGYASSPVIHGANAIVQVDVHGGAYLAAWDLDSGEQRWRVERNVVPSWATPALLRTPRGDELVVNGSTIHGYDPRDGRELWSLGPNSELVIATPVAGDGVVYVSAGYPPVKPIYAVRAGTRGAFSITPGAPHERLLWSHERGGAYMPTPLLYRGLLYVVHHNGRIVAYEARSGTAVYKSRFSGGGTFTASPIAVNGKLYVPTEEGQVYVLEAGPEYRELAVNEMGEPVMATPAVSEGVLYIRTPRRLVAIGRP